MLELIVISVGLLLGFVGLTWYARFRSHRRSAAFKPRQRAAEPELAPTFSARLAAEMAEHNEQIDLQADVAELDEAPVVNVSSVASASEPAPSIVTAPPYAQAELDLSDSADTPFIAERQSMSDEANQAHRQAQQKDWDAVFALTIMAAKGHLFQGTEIAAALAAVDMAAGEMAIFHRDWADQPRTTLFSAANMVAPGTLKPTDLATLQTPGLVMFMRLPGPTNGLLAFDAMLDAADKVAKRLNGQLRDEHRQVLTTATLEAMRRRILQFNLTP